ncbi:hypothetical protein FRX31_030866 [Thalictrum thalictroides]|uniref:Uncharacterized protein n=1 Tax=Thalictrum thalictroides TaxID=46969 RepID=A0A7J6V5V7_THATH|nr:hypothetical protein FRX31_030866 [Thalictrum thalictroides]
MNTIEVSSVMHQKSLFEEMRELGKLRTAVMMEKCKEKDEVLVCPKPRRQNIRQCGGKTSDLKAEAELSDLIMSKASPPFFVGSPPMRSNNPLVRDARFREQRLQQNSSFGVNSVDGQTQKTWSITTMG